jgi:hypothetical protein
MIQKFADIPVNDVAKSVVQRVVVGGSPQTKDALVAAVFGEHNIRAMVRVVGATFPGWQWDKAIETHVLFVITFELHRKDDNGVRIYQCWPAGGGRWLWEPFSAFDLPKLQMLKGAATSRRRQAEVIEQRIDLWIEEVQARGGTAGDVYPIVVAKLHRPRAA